MNGIIRNLIIGKYKTMEHFWSEYRNIYNSKISNSYGRKYQSGLVEIPDSMMWNIFKMVEITRRDIIEIIHYSYNISRLIKDKKE